MILWSYIKWVVSRLIVAREISLVLPGSKNLQNFYKQHIQSFLLNTSLLSQILHRRFWTNSLKNGSEIFGSPLREWSMWQTHSCLDFVYYSKYKKMILIKICDICLFTTMFMMKRKALFYCTDEGIRSEQNWVIWTKIILFNQQNLNYC